jgi:DNA invertase Pin-like site-specific DNA recombinase
MGKRQQKKVVGVYARASSTVGSTNGSQARQVSAAHKIAAQNHQAVSPENVFFEQISGMRSITDRQPLLDAIRQCDKLYVESGRALARTPGVAEEIRQTAAAHGCTIVAGDIPEAMASSAAGRFAVRMFDAFYAFERELIIERLMHGKARAAALGKRTGGRRTMLAKAANPMAVRRTVLKLNEKKQKMKAQYSYYKFGKDLATKHPETFKHPPAINVPLGTFSKKKA